MHLCKRELQRTTIIAIIIIVDYRRLLAKRLLQCSLTSLHTQFLYFFNRVITTGDHRSTLYERVLSLFGSKGIEGISRTSSESGEYNPLFGSYAQNMSVGRMAVSTLTHIA